MCLLYQIKYCKSYLHLQDYSITERFLGNACKMGLIALYDFGSKTGARRKTEASPTYVSKLHSTWASRRQERIQKKKKGYDDDNELQY